MPETDRFDCQLCELANNIDDMAQCDDCDKWFHYGCVGFDDGKKHEDWKCNECIVKSITNDGTVNNVNSGSNSTSASGGLNRRQQDANASTGGESIGELAQLNLKLLEERKAFLLKEIELQQTIQLEQRKLQLENEVWKARYEIINARCATSSGAVDNGGPGDWMSRLNQVAVGQAKQLSATASTATVRTTDSGIGSQIPATGRETSATSSLPDGTQCSKTESVSASQITSAAMPPQGHLSSSIHPLGQATSFVHEFQPAGANRPGSSTPITTVHASHQAVGPTRSIQCLPPSISSLGQLGSHPVQSGYVSQPYQVTSTLRNFAPVGQATVSQYANVSVGQSYPQMNSQYANSSAGQNYAQLSSQYANCSIGHSYSQMGSINAHSSYAPFPPPTSLSQTNPHFSQPPLGGLQMQSTAHIDNCTPTSRQLAARHAMPKELPSFSGNPEEWPMFISAFNTSTEACGYSNVENLGRLQRCLKGGALEAVRSRLLLPASVPQVIQTLQLLYGRPEQIIYALLQKVRDVPAPKSDNLCTVVSFGMAVQNFCEHLEAAGQVLHLANPVLLQELVDKLPANLKLDWVAFKRQFLVADLRVFGRYMENLVSAAAEVTLTLDLKGAKSKKEDKLKSFVNAHGTPVRAAVPEAVAVKPKMEAVKATSPIACLVCGNPEHRVKACDVFGNMDRDDRWKVVHSNYLCRTCLGKHGRKPCRSSARCDVQGCKMRHHPLLHGEPERSPAATKSRLPKSGAEQRGNPTEGVNAHHTQSSTLFRMLPVRLFSKERSVETLAFIDEGSSVNRSNRRR